MRVHAARRNNLILNARVPPPDDPPPLNTYSWVVVAAWNRAQSMAADCGHPIVGLHHFISGLFNENDASSQLRAMGYTDDRSDIRQERHRLFGLHKAISIELPLEGLKHSDRLLAWFEAANAIAERREYELRTITVSDFVMAVHPDLVLENDALRVVQEILGKYRQNAREIAFTQKVIQSFGSLEKLARDRFDHVDAVAEANRDQVLTAIQRVDGHIGVVDGHVGEVDWKVDAVRADAIKHREESRAEHLSIKEDTTAIRASLPKELRLARTLMGLGLLLAAFAGSLVGLLARSQYGVL